MAEDGACRDWVIMEARRADLSARLVLACDAAARVPTWAAADAARRLGGEVAFLRSFAPGRGWAAADLMSASEARAQRLPDGAEWVAKVARSAARRVVEGAGNVSTSSAEEAELAARSAIVVALRGEWVSEAARSAKPNARERRAASVSGAAAHAAELARATADGIGAMVADRLARRAARHASLAGTGHRGRKLRRVAWVVARRAASASLRAGLSHGMSGRADQLRALRVASLDAAGGGFGAVDSADVVEAISCLSVCSPAAQRRLDSIMRDGAWMAPDGSMVQEVDAEDVDRGADKVRAVRAAVRAARLTLRDARGGMTAPAWARVVASTARVGLVLVKVARGESLELALAQVRFPVRASGTDGARFASWSAALARSGIREALSDLVRPRAGAV